MFEFFKNFDFDALGKAGQFLGGLGAAYEASPWSPKSKLAEKSYKQQLDWNNYQIGVHKQNQTNIDSAISNSMKKREERKKIGYMGY